MSKHTLPDGTIIHTNFDYPPIPVRSHDWSAHLDNYDGAPDAGWQPVGCGRTEQEAIDDLLQQIEDYDEGYAREEAADMKREELRDAQAEKELDYSADEEEERLRGEARSIEDNGEPF